MCNCNISWCNRVRRPETRGFGALAPLFLALLLIGLTGAPASAHGIEVQDADPAPGSVLDEPPAVVTIVFTEELVDGESGFQVLDGDGNAVDDGDAALDLNDPEHATLVAHISRVLSDGVYTVSYRAQVLDGDVTQGEFRFAVGDQYAAQALATPVSAQQADPTPAPTSPPPADAQQGSSPFLFIALIAIALIVVALVVIFIVKRSKPSGPDNA